MRAVLDTGVFLRALINPGGSWGCLLFDLADRYVIVQSPDMVKEMLSVLYRSGLRGRFPKMAKPASLRRVLEILEQAEVVEPAAPSGVRGDPKSDKLFECAVAGGANYVVSDDQEILEVGEFEGITAVSSEEFIAVLSLREPGWRRRP
jgi:putative PIN family toxin of toxin-antitoxin system